MPRGPRASGGRSRIAGILLALLTLLVPLGPAGATAPSPIHLDFTHLEAFRQPTWVEVALPANSVTLVNVRVLTANREWLLRVCESPADPGTCSLLVGTASAPARGRSGDYFNPALNLSYTDRTGSSRLHLLVTPIHGDWMIFRIQAVVRP